MAPTRCDDLDDRDLALARDLKRLAPPRAPRTLLPRVMAASARPAMRPWYTCRWLTWPAGWQMLSTAALGTLIAAALLFIPRINDLVTNALSRFAWRMPASVATFVANVDNAASLTRIAWHVWLEPVIAAGFMLGIVLSLGCFACRQAVKRLALGGASQS